MRGYEKHTVSIVVPSYNRPEQLRRCLTALQRLVGGPYDIVVVDDGSATPLASVCAEFGPNVRCIRQENAGPAAARNSGGRESNANFIAFTDDDCQPEPRWLVELVAAHAGQEDRLVGGHVVNALEDNPYAAASQSLCNYLYDYFGADAGDMPFFTSNNMGLSRQAFERLGGFDETFPLAAAEDRDFGLRWKEAGMKLVFASAARVKHHHALTFRGFWRQHSNYGKGARHLHAVMTARGSPLPQVEPPRFYLGLVFYPLRRARKFRVVQSVLLGLSQVAMVQGYSRAARSNGGRQALVRREVL